MSNIKEIIEKADLKKQENKELQQEKFMYEITKEVKSINNNIKFFFFRKQERD